MPAAEKMKLSQEKAGEWYDKNVKTYDKYAQCVHGLLETLLKEEGIPYQSITFRVKERESFLKKYKDKDYKSPEQIMDVAGLRIIAYTIGDVERICALVEQELEIDRENSVDKATQLNSDQMGYLSVHYIASFTNQRAELREYRAYKGMKCEIQVRTLLQHTWAEFEHDRGYKFSGVLPKNIERKFYPLAGLLELADQEFQRLSEQLDEYSKTVAKETSEGNLDFSIDSTSLFEFMRQKFPQANPSNNLTTVIEELMDMGIWTLGDLEKLLPNTFLDAIEEKKSNTYIGILRDAMMFYDIDRYFSKAWNRHWGAFYAEDIPWFKRHGFKIEEYMKEYDLVVDEEE